MSEVRALEPSGTVAVALVAAGLPMAKVAGCRGRHLSPAERELYVWILRRFSEEGAPSADEIVEEAARLALDLAQMRNRFAVEDLIHFDGDGEVAVAYPFSGHPTPHRVRIDDREVYAMCAIDALGVAPMLGRPIDISSRDPLTNAEINVRLDPDGTGSWRPSEAVVVAGRAREGAAFSGCCQVLNFFASHENAERYLRERADVHGFPITMTHAIELGRVIFGDVLKQN